MIDRISEISRFLGEHKKSIFAASIGVPVVIAGSAYQLRRHTAGIDDVPKFTVNSQAAEYAVDVLDREFARAQRRELVVRNPDSPRWKIGELEVGDNYLKYLTSMLYEDAEVDSTDFRALLPNPTDRSIEILAQDIKRERARDVIDPRRLAEEDKDNMVVTIYVKNPNGQSVRLLMESGTPLGVQRVRGYTVIEGKRGPLIDRSWVYRITK